MIKINITTLRVSLVTMTEITTWIKQVSNLMEVKAHSREEITIIRILEKLVQTNMFQRRIIIVIKRTTMQGKNNNKRTNLQRTTL